MCQCGILRAGCFDFRVERMGGVLMVEPWLRGTRLEVDAVRRGVIHALELAAEDVAKWCEGLSDEEMRLGRWGCLRWGSSCGICSVAGSAADLCGGAAIERATDGGSADGDGVGGTGGFVDGVCRGGGGVSGWVIAISPRSFQEGRGVGKKNLPR